MTFFFPRPLPAVPFWFSPTQHLNVPGAFLIFAAKGGLWAQESCIRLVVMFSAQNRILMIGSSRMCPPLARQSPSVRETQMSTRSFVRVRHQRLNGQKFFLDLTRVKTRITVHLPPPGSGGRQHEKSELKNQSEKKKKEGGGKKNKNYPVLPFLVFIFEDGTENHHQKNKDFSSPLNP